VKRLSDAAPSPKQCDIAEHLTAAERIVDGPPPAPVGKTILTRATGKFYTHELIGRHLAESIARDAALSELPEPLCIVEPFCGDGRLICWLLEAIARATERRAFRLELWDGDGEALRTAAERVKETADQLGLRATTRSLQTDTFLFAPEHFGRFHLCVTNPPWENLKPDRRELKALPDDAAGEYVGLLKRRDEALTRLYPRSQPRRKFSGWGTNLARCGVEVALSLLAPGGIAGFVSPSSLLADQSEVLRRWIFECHSVRAIAYYVAEARLFEKVDQPCITAVAVAGGRSNSPPRFSICDRNRRRKAASLSAEQWSSLEKNSYIFPLEFGMGLVGFDARWAAFPRFEDLERTGEAPLWAGRELDETNHARFLGPEGEFLFVKGRMLERFGVVEAPTQYVTADGPRVPGSARHPRVAWRDVSRPSQKRRLHATIIPAGWVTGNSLHVAYFEDDDEQRLKALLGVMNSLVFESQARALLATAHVSLGIVRRVAIPRLDDEGTCTALAALVNRRLTGDVGAELELEAVVARLYGLNKRDYAKVISSFEKIGAAERDALLAAWSESLSDKPLAPVLRGEGLGVRGAFCCGESPLTPNPSPRSTGARGASRTDSEEQMPAKPRGGAAQLQRIVIPNHLAPPLSDLDRRMVEAVPPGGNWKNIPTSVPSQRLEQIRESYAAGEGSRSTYYGRLHPDAPSYTINTYFSRPGNGCHVHYDFDGGQHRTISQREAARLQSFPDRFVFHGSRAAINQQIGNAVPPLLAYQIARALPFRGRFVDLFCGAGGLGLGFLWAGWEPAVANDVEEAYLTTYRANIHERAIAGDIRESAVLGAVVEAALKARKARPRMPLFVLGGPPCQGFSTAGNKRSMGDERNWLFRQYRTVIESVKPAGFVFENVTGLLNMEGGKVFEMIRGELEGLAKGLRFWQLRSEFYGIPQRRARVVLLGDQAGDIPAPPPAPVTRAPDDERTLFDPLPPWISVRQALSDLPPLEPGEDGSGKDYATPPAHPYQRLMRSLITPEEYLAAISTTKCGSEGPCVAPRTRARSSKGVRRK
jgi:Alw26I/Eco31I/Esp3I family type II restriction m6 adenine DNA methyltransferase